MELIRNLLYGFQFLAEKITKKKRRSCAVILVGSVAVAAVAFTSNALGSGGKNAVYAAAEKDNPSQEEKEPEEEEAYTLTPEPETQEFWLHRIRIILSAE